MESLPWSITRKHQTNNSASKQAFGFVKEKRFKDKKLVLYPIVYLDATLSTTSLLLLATHPHPVSASVINQTWSGPNRTSPPHSTTISARNSNHSKEESSSVTVEA